MVNFQSSKYLTYKPQPYLFDTYHLPSTICPPPTSLIFHFQSLILFFHPILSTLESSFLVLFCCFFLHPFSWRSHLLFKYIKMLIIPKFIFTAKTFLLNFRYKYPLLTHLKLGCLMGILNPTCQIKLIFNLIFPFMLFSL